MAAFTDEMLKQFEDRAGMPVRQKYKEPTNQLVQKDPDAPPDEMLEVDKIQLKMARKKDVMPTMTIKFLEDGPDRTVDDWTNFPNEVTIEGMSAQNRVYDLKMMICQQENMEPEDVNLFLWNNKVPLEWRIGECYSDCAHQPYQQWPPEFICKRRIRGFEIFVHFPKSRDVMEWVDGKPIWYFARHLVFDMESTSTVSELKSCITKNLGIPEHRLQLSACLRKHPRDMGFWVDLDDDSRTMKDYELDEFCVDVKAIKKACADDGMFVFDECYWDEAGYVPQPEGCWISPDSVSDRSRPDAHKVDPNLPPIILTDHNAAKAARAAEIEWKKKLREGTLDDDEEYEDWGDWQE